MFITARNTLEPLYHDTTASTTTTVGNDILPAIDWSFLFRTQEEQLELDAKKEIERQKQNKLILKLKRKTLFTKKGKY